MKSIVCLLVIITSFCLQAGAQDYRNVKVGLFVDKEPTRTALSVADGVFTLYGDGKPVMQFGGQALLIISVEGKRIRVKNYNKNLGAFSSVSLIPKQESAIYRLKNVQPETEERRYEGSLTVEPKSGKLKFVASVTMDQYIAGVVQSEAGNGHKEEFYKAQAIISRTYALKHINRFLSKGYNLCDRVHSQVYKTMGYNDTIRNAVQSTREVVLVDADINLITAAFHSNSGGFTSNSEDVWTGSLPYLRAREDTFSRCMPHYEWNKKVSLDEYMNYFNLFTELNPEDPATRREILNYCPQGVQHFFFPSDSLVPLKSMRTFFELNSTDFCVDQKQDSVLFVGRGFGHGIGLSQEGAMRMAELGYDHREILSHYYKNTHLISLSVIDFFRGEN